MNNLLKIMTCGDVDNGKSTILGHLLYDNNLIYEDQKAKIKDNQYAHILDGLSVEQEQNITIDIAYRFFTLENRKFILADCPGHIQYTQNMATGASNSDLAIVVLDITKGLTEQTCHHLNICNFMGITNFIIAINKIDLINYDSIIFNDLKNKIEVYCKNLNIDSLIFIPISGLQGDNISFKSTNMSWYSGLSLIDYLKIINIDKKETKNNNQDIFLVQHISLNNNKRYIEGYLSQGTLNINDKIIVLPSNEEAIINKLYHNGIEVSEIEEGQNCSIVIDRELDVSRGTILVSKYTNKVKLSNNLNTDLILFDKIDYTKDYLFKNETNQVICKFTEDIYELNTMLSNIEIQLQQELPLCTINNDKQLGHFIIIDIITHKVVSYGHINKLKDIKKSDNFTLWFTGLSGAGKTTLANALKNKYPEYKFIILDGDEIRNSLNTDLGFSIEDRKENIRRISELAKLLNNQNYNVIVSCISPTNDIRAIAKNIIGNSYKEVYISTPLTTCISRDVKGLYNKYKNGKLNNFTGLDALYEVPLSPDYVLDTSNRTIDDCILELNNFLNCR